MKVIVFASSKGGVGKTTLAFNAAIHAANAGVGVQLADRDPQRSLMELCRRRRDTPELVADNPMLLDSVETISSTVRLLTNAGYDREFLIVDTPGSFMEVLREAIGMADVVLVPLRPSPLDLLAQEAVLDMVDAMGKRDRTLIAVNMADARSPLLADTLKAVRPMSPHKPVVIANRQDYARAVITARAGIEINREAAAEISTLWDAIKRIARQGNGGKIQRRHGKSSKQARKARSRNAR